MLMKTLFVLWMSGVPRVVDDEMRALDVLCATCVCRLTKHALVTILLVWSMFGVGRVFNHATDQRTTKKVHARFYAFTCRKCALIHARTYAHVCGKFKLSCTLLAVDLQ